METLVEKSVKLTGYLEFLLGEIERRQNFYHHAFKSIDERGCQLSIRVKNADKSF